jgi:hypothetical protein
MSEHLDRSGGLQNPALGDRAVAALPDEGGQLSPKGAEIGQLPVHLGQVLPRDGVNGLAGSLPLVGEVEEGADLLEEKPRSRARRTKLSRARCPGP